LTIIVIPGAHVEIVIEILFLHRSFASPGARKNWRRRISAVP
jgi:hypothetical protein